MEIDSSVSYLLCDSIKLEGLSLSDDQTNGDLSDHIDRSVGHIDALNEYCLAHLMSFLAFRELTSARLVCRRWMFAIDAYLRLKRTAKLVNSYANLTYNLSLCDPNEEHLLAVTNNYNSAHILTTIGALCPKLVALEFVYITIDEHIVSSLTQNFTRLTELTIAHPLGFSEDNLKLIIDKFGAQLKCLNIRDCDIGEECLHYVLQRCPNLVTLDVSGNADITGHCFLELNDKLEVLLLGQCQSIGEFGLDCLVRSEARNSVRELHISGMITDTMMATISVSLSKLTSLSCVYGCTREFGSDANLLGVIGLHMTRLEKLSLQEVDAYYGSLDDKSLLSIMRGCSRLKYLEIHVGSGEKLLVTDSSLALISHHCQHIECLKLYYAEAITDKTLISVSKLKHLRRLELINLYKISDEGVITVMEMCANLRRLWISFDGNRESITNSTLNACIDMCRKRAKQRVDVDFFETSISVPFNLVIPHNMRLRVSWYRQTPEGRRYTEIKLPQ